MRAEMRADEIAMAAQPAESAPTSFSQMETSIAKPAEILITEKAKLKVAAPSRCPLPILRPRVRRMQRSDA